MAVDELACQLIVLDDAFQHRRIHRDLDLVMLDALEPFGFGHVFPRGTLREPLARAPPGRRRRAVAGRHARLPQERARRPQGNQPVRTRGRLGRSHPRPPGAALVDRREASARHTPRTTGGRLLRASATRPDFGTRSTRCGYRVAAFREFPDHHRYDRGDVESLIDWADRFDVAAVLTTHKDLVKLSVDRLGRHRLRAVAVGLEFLDGESGLEAKLEALAPRQA